MAKHDARDDEPIVGINVTPLIDGSLALDGLSITEDELAARALAYTGVHHELASATVTADGATDQARFVHVLDVLRRAGVHRLGIRAR